MGEAIPEPVLAVSPNAEEGEQAVGGRSLGRGAPRAMATPRMAMGSGDKSEVVSHAGAVEFDGGVVAGPSDGTTARPLGSRGVERSREEAWPGPAGAAGPPVAASHCSVGGAL